MTDDKKANPWKLTPREREVLSLFMVHSSAKSVGRQLGVEQKTVENLCKQARNKMGNCTRLQACVYLDRWLRDIGAQA